MFLVHGQLALHLFFVHGQLFMFVLELRIPTK